MNILYLTDDRSKYTQGYYYVDWAEIFCRHHNVTLWGPGYPKPEDGLIAKTDLLIIGHGAFDVLRQTGYLSYRRRLLQTLRGKSSFGYWPKDLLDLKCPRIFLSKNDYKLIEQKVSLVQQAHIDLTITHSKRAVSDFLGAAIACEWIPFGVNTDRFTNDRRHREICIGFRGNLNDQWNGGVRAELIGSVRQTCSDLSLDILTSQEGEGFLYGRDYVEWMNDCHLIVNTVSAIGTVGPKWWEQMACGCVPLAPVDDYEGLLQPDVHYLAIEPDFSNLRQKVDRFFNDPDFQQHLQHKITEMATEAKMENRYKAMQILLEKYKLL